jgi:hypothetical protein
VTAMQAYHQTFAHREAPRGQRLTARRLPAAQRGRQSTNPAPMPGPCCLAGHKAEIPWFRPPATVASVGRQGLRALTCCWDRLFYESNEH